MVLFSISVVGARFTDKFFFVFHGALFAVGNITNLAFENLLAFDFFLENSVVTGITLSAALVFSHNFARVDVFDTFVIDQVVVIGVRNLSEEVFLGQIVIAVNVLALNDFVLHAQNRVFILFRTALARTIVVFIESVQTQVTL